MSASGLSKQDDIPEQIQAPKSINFIFTAQTQDASEWYARDLMPKNNKWIRFHLRIIKYR